MGSLLLFRLGALDAQQFEPYIRPALTARDLEDLPDHQVVARLLVEGSPTRPYVFKSLSPGQFGQLSKEAACAAAEILARNRVEGTCNDRAVPQKEQQMRQGRKAFFKVWSQQCLGGSAESPALGEAYEA